MSYQRIEISIIIQLLFTTGDYLSATMSKNPSSLVPTTSTIQYMYGGGNRNHPHHDEMGDYHDRRVRQDDEMSAVSSTDSIVDIGTTSSSSPPASNTVGVIASTATKPPSSSSSSKKERKQKVCFFFSDS